MSLPGPSVLLLKSPGSGALGSVQRTPRTKRSDTHILLPWHVWLLEQVQGSGLAQPEYLSSSARHASQNHPPADRSPNSPEVTRMPGFLPHPAKRLLCPLAQSLHLFEPVFSFIKKPHTALEDPDLEPGLLLCPAEVLSGVSPLAIAMRFPTQPRPQQPLSQRSELYQPFPLSITSLLCPTRAHWCYYLVREGLDQGAGGHRKSADPRRQESSAESFHSCPCSGLSRDSCPSH